MREITITELQKRSGAAIDAALKYGELMITRHGNSVAILSSRPPKGLDLVTMTATEFWRSLPGSVDTLNLQAIAIVRKGRREPTAYLCQAICSST